MDHKRYAALQHTQHKALTLPHPTLDVTAEISWNESSAWLETRITGTDAASAGTGWYQYGISEMSVYDSGAGTISSPPVESDTPEVYYTAYTQNDDLLFTWGMANTTELVFFNEVRGGHITLGGRSAAGAARYLFDLDIGNRTLEIGNFTFDLSQTVGVGQDNYVLTYDHSNLTIGLEAASGGGGGGATQLSELSDVNTSTATNRNVLVADGTDWESRALVEADISDLASYITDYTVTEGDVTAHEAALTITESQISDLGTYQVDLDVVSQAEAEAGTATTERIWTAERVAQAIAALESGGGGSSINLWKAKGNLSSASFDDTENALSWNAFAIDGGSDITLSGSEVTVGTGGTYKFTVTLRTDNGNRTELFIRTYINTGSGLTQDTDEIVSDYVSRDADQDTGSVTLVTALALDATDVVEFRGFGDTDGTSIGLDAGTILVIEGPY